jgi:integration host factor subunit beta
MIKSELVSKLAAENPHLYKRDVEAIVDAILNTITAALARGDRVELRGFGVFTAKKRSERNARNPRSGKTVEVPEKAFPVFKPGREMHRRLNSPAPSQPAPRLRQGWPRDRAHVARQHVGA